MAFWNLSHVFREPKKDWVTTGDRGKARSKAARSPSPVPEARKAGSPVGKPWEKPLENHGKTIIKKIEKKHGYDSFTQSSLFFYTWIWPSRGGIAKHDHQFSVAAFLTALSVFFRPAGFRSWGVWAPLQDLCNTREGPDCTMDRWTCGPPAMMSH